MAASDVGNIIIDTIDDVTVLGAAVINDNHTEKYSHSKT